MKKNLLIIFSVLLLAIAGCGKDNDDDAGKSDNKAKAPNDNGKGITITDSADREVTFEDVPKNIVSLSNGEMDIIYALGAELVGRPTSNGPAAVKEAEDVEQIGTTHGIDLEKITALEPDVILGNNPMNTKDIAAVEGIGTQMILTSANSIDEIKQQTQLLGELLQKEDKAKELIQSFDEKLKELKAKQWKDKPRTLLVYGAPDTNMAALPNSLAGNILEMAGGENIAADYPSLDSFPQYAQLNTERIIESNPQFILLMTHGDPEEVKKSLLKEMEQNAGWSDLDAVKNNAIEVLPSNLFGTNPGTRVTESLDLLNNLFEDIK